MNTQKIINIFETRKRVTDKAFNDLYDIMQWITETVDNVNVFTEKTISYRASNGAQFGTWHRNSADENMFLAVRHGKCGLYYDAQYEYIYAEKSDIDYINLAETVEALHALFSKLEEIGTRENSSNSIAKIKKMTDAEKLADAMNTRNDIPDTAIDEFDVDPEKTLEKYNI